MRGPCKLSKIYSLLISNIGLPLVTFLSDSSFWLILKRFERNQTSISNSSALEKLNSRLKHANKEVPFYRDRFLAVGFDPDKFTNLEDLTVLLPLTK